MQRATNKVTDREKQGQKEKEIKMKELAMF